MAEGLSTEDGTQIDLDQAEAEFAAAMNAPEPDEPVHAAPPKREQLSEEELGAKYGWTTDAQGNRRAKRAKGRPSSKPRETTAPPPPQEPKGGKKDATAKPDFTGPLTDFTDALWMVAAATPIPADVLRVKVRSQAKVLKATQGGLVQGVNMMAQHNGMIRRGVEALTMGGAGWVLPAVMALAPFAVQSAAVWRAEPQQLVAMAQETEREWAEEFAAMTAAFEAEKAHAEAFEQEFGQEAALCPTAWQARRSCAARTGVSDSSPGATSTRAATVPGGMQAGYAAGSERGFPSTQEAT